MNTTSRKALEAIFRAGLSAVDPGQAVRRHVRLEGTTVFVGEVPYDLSRFKRILVLGAGKASASMAAALETILGDRIADGWVNVKVGHGLPLKKIHVHEAGHPLPDEAGVKGAREIARLLEATTENNLVFFCISGGGSALLPLPANEISLDDKQAMTQALLACGATIHEINTVRKHVSRLKGGQLARLAYPSHVATLILSDVIGDPLDTIASGPTVPDTTTFAQALEILDRYDIVERTPESIVRHLCAGVRGSIPDTPKPGDALFEAVNNVLVGTNRAAVAACVAQAESMGYAPLLLTTTLQGEARTAAEELVSVARQALVDGTPVKPPACIIAGGETTVTLQGDGLGGRNQEFALAAALAAKGANGLSVLAAGTDGTDGPTDAAGAFADGDTCRLAEAAGLDPTDYLTRNDSYHFFEQLGDLFKTGPTGTNVMDLYLLLVE